MQNHAFVVNPFTREGYYLNGLKEGWHKFDSKNVKEIDPYYTDPKRIKDDLELAYPTRMVSYRDIEWFESFSHGVFDIVYCQSSMVIGMGSIIDSFHYATTHYGNKETLKDNQILIVFHDDHLYYTANVSVIDIVQYIDEHVKPDLFNNLYEGPSVNWPFIGIVFSRARAEYNTFAGIGSRYNDSHTCQEWKASIAHSDMEHDLHGNHFGQGISTKSDSVFDRLREQLEKRSSTTVHRFTDRKTKIPEVRFTFRPFNDSQLTVDDYTVAQKLLTQDGNDIDHALWAFIEQTKQEGNNTVATRIKEREDKPSVFKSDCDYKLPITDMSCESEQHITESDSLEGYEETETEERRLIIGKPKSKVALFAACAFALSGSNLNGYTIPRYFDNSTRPYTGLSGKAPTYRGGKSKASKSSKVKGKGKRK